jgi:hypothetical protein
LTIGTTPTVEDFNVFPAAFATDGCAFLETRADDFLPFDMVGNPHCVFCGKETSEARESVNGASLPTNSPFSLPTLIVERR